MVKPGNTKDKNAKKIVNEILKSNTQSRIYIFLLKKDGAKTEQIIKGTKLHPSTVRDALSKMYEQKLINRKKIKNGHIGKNPYIYYAISPLKLLKKYTNEMENRLNKLACLTLSKEDRERYRPVKIKISERFVWLCK